MLVMGELMVEPKDDLIQGVRNLIIQRLKLVDMTPEMIDRDAPLFGEGLGLDSIDALELVLGLEKEYGVIIPDAEVGKRVFQSVRTIAQYILEQKVGS
jgi:acyl carrier protein